VGEPLSFTVRRGENRLNLTLRPAELPRQK